MVHQCFLVHSTFIPDSSDVQAFSPLSRTPSPALPRFSFTLLYLLPIRMETRWYRGYSTAITAGKVVIPTHVVMSIGLNFISL